MCMHASTEGLGTQCVPAFESSEMMAAAPQNGGPLRASDPTGDGGQGTGRPMRRSRRQSAREAEAAELAGLLPILPKQEVQEYIGSDDVIDLIGANLLIWERVPMVHDTVPIKECMEPEDWEAHARGMKSYWGAKLRCTFCGAEYHGFWGREKEQTRLLIQDSELGYSVWDMDGWAKGPDVDGERTAAAYDGGNVTCPTCGRWLSVVPKRWLRTENQVFRLRMATMETIGGWGGVFYWIAEIPLDRNGDGLLLLTPECALVNAKSGGLLRFVYEEERWRYKPERKARKELPPLQAFDRDMRNTALRCQRAPLSAGAYWSEGQGGRRQGNWIHWAGRDWCGTLLNELEDSTLEKTGLDAFVHDDLLEDEPWIAEAYLRYWGQHPRIEVLARDGWRDLCRSIVRGEYPEELLDWGKAKPHQIIGLSKEDYRATRQNGYYQRWRTEALREFRRYNLGRKDPITAVEFNAMSEAFDVQLYRWTRAADGRPAADWDLRKAGRYLEGKRRKTKDGMETLLDYRLAAESLHALHTNRDLWPKDLQAEHDKACASAKLTGATPEICLAFRRLAEELAPLTWTDGTYLIRAAASPAELIEEGDALHHCVGTYAKGMAAREDVIFFVRRRRRPERSWMTLCINMSGDEPYEAALHGWWNEGTPAEPGVPWMKPKRQIQKRCRQVVDRWKKEVLEPWWAATHGKQPKRTRRKTA